MESRYLVYHSHMLFSVLIQDDLELLYVGNKRWLFPLLELVKLMTITKLSFRNMKKNEKKNEGKKKNREMRMHMCWSCLSLMNWGEVYLFPFTYIDWIIDQIYIRPIPTIRTINDHFSSKHLYSKLTFWICLNKTMLLKWDLNILRMTSTCKLHVNVKMYTKKCILMEITSLIS